MELRLPAIGQVTRARVVDFGKVLWREISEDRVTGVAAEVAFFGVLSVFPGLLIIASALGSLNDILGVDLAETVKGVVIDFLDRILTDQARQPINATQELFREGKGGLLTVSIVTALYALARGFMAVIRALDLAYDVAEQRHWLRQSAVALILGIGSVAVTVLMLVSFVAGPLLGGGGAIVKALSLTRELEVMWNVVRWPASLALSAAWATVLYHIGPHRKGTLRDELPGALFASVGWMGVSLGFSLYLRLAASANQILGVLGGGLILLVWLYLLSLVLLIGGEINSMFRTGRRRAAKGTRLPAEPVTRTA